MLRVLFMSADKPCQRGAFFYVFNTSGRYEGAFSWHGGAEMYAAELAAAFGERFVVTKEEPPDVNLREAFARAQKAGAL